MSEPSRFEIWYGRDEPPVETRELRAGPLTALLEGVDLRYVHLGDVEIVRRLFVAVRDSSWGTIPPRISELEVDAGDDSFRVTFEAFHEAGDIRFRWRGLFAGSADGTLECRMDGLPEADFPYNRIGFCVLHPREHAGRSFRTRTPEGEDTGRLPDEIGPQRIEDGKLWPLFPSFDRLELEVEDGLWARFEFEGDLFEMEDQRNWTDASFKTYSTPITLGWPHQATAGRPIAQAVKLSFSGQTDRPRREAGGSVRIELGEPTHTLLPPLGLGMASHGEPLSEREAELITLLGPDHLRADLRLGTDGWRDELERAGASAIATAAGLELALFLGDEPEAELDALAAALPLAQARVLRFLVLEPGQAVTGSGHVRAARERLAPAASEALFAAGTDQWFTELNRARPDVDGADAIVYSICATVHAEDDTSVRETAAAQADTVRSARALFGNRPVFVSTVTIKPRLWPFGELEGFRGLPYQADPRQCGLFGAVWTAASVKHLAEAEAASLTYFETTGLRGVAERESGSVDPDVFPSRAGTPFPLYHVLADVCEWRREATVCPARSSDPLAVEAFAVNSHAGTHALVVNLTPSPQRCALGSLARDTASVRVLDEESAAIARDDPEAFRARREQRAAPGGTLELELQPYAVVRVDP